jgi:glycosyltransferase involved in cell wall biosynthesis
MPKPDLRILFLTAETCPTFRADVNVLFGKYLPRHGILTDIVAGRTPGIIENVQWGGGEAFLCDVEGGATKKHIKILWHSIWQLFRAERSRYKAFQVRDMPVLAAFGLLAARIKGLPFYYWMSYPIPEGQIELAMERGMAAGLMKFLFPLVSGQVGRFLLYRVVLRRADQVFVQSDRMKEDMVARGVSPARMTPVPMGVDLEDVRLENLPPVDDARLKGRRILVYLGTLDRPRRIEILFEMLGRVRRQIPEALLILVGDTADDVHRAWLMQQAQKAEVADAVLWTGWLPMKEGWRYVRAAEVALSPFPRGYLLDCSSPTKVPEYLALGVPVVCNDNPDQAKVIHESGAGLCVPYTPEEFAAAVLSILRKKHDDENQLLSSGFDYVKAQRSYERISLMVAEVYKKLL